ncbi:hypothetical protein Sjap_021767 [Stephania japonica]|uniref:Wall-associated receptor kinase galacturonan-binding domain-containing protein n=1 Tax=Stephania japonica TaxID=461633 RepID=A0AAP0HUE7_9MAGN
MNMSFLLSFLSHFLLQLVIPTLVSSSQSACKNKCGSLDIQFPLGSGHGCGSPRFFPYVTCEGEGDAEHLVLTTHTGTYPITSISYATSTLTISPPHMSNCSSMHASPASFGIDWASPFHLGSSAFILLACSTTSSTICDASYAHLCASIHSCPAISSLGLSPFAPTTSCCVYSPSNLNTKGDLDLQTLKCNAYSSVVSLGDIPTDPNQWDYGIELKYMGEAGFDSNILEASCRGCERSEGICGYAPPRNDFVCVCNGMNSSGTGASCNSNQGVPYSWGSYDDQSKVVPWLKHLL